MQIKYFFRYQLLSSVDCFSTFCHHQQRVLFVCFVSLFLLSSVDSFCAYEFCFPLSSVESFSGFLVYPVDCFFQIVLLSSVDSFFQFFCYSSVDCFSIFFCYLQESRGCCFQLFAGVSSADSSVCIFVSLFLLSSADRRQLVVCGFCLLLSSVDSSSGLLQSSADSFQFLLLS